VSATLHTVHVRVNDAAGQPTPVRIRLTDPAGEYFAPFGRLTEFATGRNQNVGGNLGLGARRYAYIDGTCEVRLPAGPIRVEITKGPEHTPLDTEVTLGPGQLALRFQLERWTDPRADGWYSGDTRALFLSPHAALLEGQAEDLAIVNLLVTVCEVAGRSGRSVPALPNILAFSGQRPALEVPGHQVIVNSLNTHPVLGSLGLLNCHRVVYPLAFGGPAGLEDWSLADWCEQCHRKGGLVVWTRDRQGHPDVLYGEPLADLVLGKVDAYEVDFFEDSPFDVVPDWYGLLNAGFAVPLVGGSGKDSNAVVLGRMRTYARLGPGEEFSYKNWIEACRAGRTFITNGPLVFLRVDGQEPGTTVNLPTGSRTVRVNAVARSGVPFDTLEVIAGGEVVASTAAQGSPWTAQIEADLPIPACGWLAARCRGAQTLPHRPASQRVFAHTSAVSMRVEGQSPQIRAAAIDSFLPDLDRTLEWIGREGRFGSDSQREHLTGIFQEARAALIRRRS
jgi:hypothetical protein